MPTNAPAFLAHSVGHECRACREIRYEGPLENLRCILAKLIADALGLSDTDRLQQLLSLEERWERDADSAQNDATLLVPILEGLVRVREELHLLDPENAAIARRLRRAKARLAKATTADASMRRLVRALSGDRVRARRAA